MWKSHRSKVARRCCCSRLSSCRFAGQIGTSGGGDVVKDSSQLTLRQLCECEETRVVTLVGGSWHTPCKPGNVDYERGQKKAIVKQQQAATLGRRQELFISVLKRVYIISYARKDVFRLMTMDYWYSGSNIWITIRNVYGIKMVCVCVCVCVCACVRACVHALQGFFVRFAVQ